MKTNKFGITFFKPNKNTGRLDFIPASEVDFSTQCCLVTDERWLSIFSRGKASCKEWKKQYVYCPDNEEALEKLYSEYPEIKIIEIIKQVYLTKDKGPEGIGFLGVSCSSYDFEFTDVTSPILKSLREIFIQPAFTQEEVQKWLSEAKVPDADRIRYLYDSNFTRI